MSPKPVKPYPSVICGPCGNKYGRLPSDKWAEWRCATYYPGTCGVCDTETIVTQPRDYGHIPNWAEVAKTLKRKPKNGKSIN